MAGGSTSEHQVEAAADIGTGSREDTLSNTTDSNDKHVTFGSATVIGYHEPEIDPLTEMMEKFGEDEIKGFMRLTLTKILFRVPGKTIYNAEQHNPIWQTILALYEDPDIPVYQDIHDIVTELCPFYPPPPPAKRWTLDHFRKLIADSSQPTSEGQLECS